jgi:hypothetical protein
MWTSLAAAVAILVALLVIAGVIVFTIMLALRGAA